MVNRFFAREQIVQTATQGKSSIALLVASAALLQACPPCPAGFHQVVTPLGGGTVVVQHDDWENKPLDTGYDVVPMRTYRITVEGSDRLPDKTTVGPAGQSGVPGGEGAPAPAMPRGSVILTLNGVNYFVGAGIKTTFQSAGRLMLWLNLPPAEPAPGHGTPAPPNTVNLDLSMKMEMSESACVADSPTPTTTSTTPIPPPLSWSQVYVTYFATGTAGHCQTCHNGQPGRPSFGTTASDMLSGLSKAGELDAGKLTSATQSPLSWCRSGGSMPQDAPKLDEGACSAIRGWVEAGAAP